MGKLLVPATVFRTVANQVPQLSQPRTTLRQCDSCPYPFRDRAPTVALSREGCWRGKRSVANARAVTDAAPLSHHRRDGTAVVVATLTLHHHHQAHAHASLAAMMTIASDRQLKRNRRPSEVPQVGSGPTEAQPEGAEARNLDNCVFFVKSNQGLRG